MNAMPGAAGIAKIKLLTDDGIAFT